MLRDSHASMLYEHGTFSGKRALHARAGKSLTKALMVAVEEALQQRFGPHAGWAHTTLFISELASQRDRLPAHLQPGSRARAPTAAAAAAAAELAMAVKEDAVAEAAAAAAEELAAAVPGLPAGLRGSRKRAAPAASAEALLCEAGALVVHSRLESTARTASVLLEDVAMQPPAGEAAAAGPVPAEEGASCCLASRADSVDDSAPGKALGKGSRRLKDWRRRKAGICAGGPTGLQPSPCSSAIA